MNRSGSIVEFKNQALSHQLANVSATEICIAGSMALKLLENGMPFKVRTNLKGFKRYVIDRGLIQNRGLRLKMSSHEERIVGKPFTFLAVGWPFKPPKSGRFTDYWIGAPSASTDHWLLAGWDGDDFIQGTDAGENELYGLAGDDYLHGSAQKSDTLTGGDGDDKMFGYKGNDEIQGGKGSDVLSGGLDNDDLFGDEGNDSLYGAKGIDLLMGGDGDDLLMGGPGENHLWGGPGADRFGLLKDADHRIHDFDPFEGDRLLVRSKDMANLRILPEGSGFTSGFILDLGKKGNTTIFPKEGTDITADNIMDAISLRR